MSGEALLRDREDARLELERVTRERDQARRERDRAEQRGADIHEQLCAAVDREAKALLEAERLKIELRDARGLILKIRSVITLAAYRRGAVPR